MGYLDGVRAILRAFGAVKRAELRAFKEFRDKYKQHVHGHHLDERRVVGDAIADVLSEYHFGVDGKVLSQFAAACNLMLAYTHLEGVMEEPDTQYGCWDTDAIMRVLNDYRRDQELDDAVDCEVVQ